MYTIKVYAVFDKDLAKLDPFMQSRVLVAIEHMRINPFEDVKKLQDVGVGIFRKRVGDYRIRFDVIGKEIYLYRIRHRKDVYR